MKLFSRTALVLIAGIAVATAWTNALNIPLSPEGGTAETLRSDVLVVNISGTIKAQFPASIQIRKTGPGNQPMVIRQYSAHTGTQRFPIGMGTYLITLTANQHVYRQTVQIQSPETTIAFRVAA